MAGVKDAFERDLADLEMIVNKLESNSCTLKEILDYHGKGIKLAEKCKRALEKAEKQMDIVLVDTASGAIKEEGLLIEGVQKDG